MVRHTRFHIEHIRSIQRATCELVLRACSLTGLLFGFGYVKQGMVTLSGDVTHQSIVLSSACFGSLTHVQTAV